MAEMRIKELRKAAGMTQVELAKALGITQSTVAEWERGSSSPLAAKLPLLAKVFSVTISDLFAADAAS